MTASKPSEKIRVAVLFGGRSSEHEVSIRSAASIVEALDEGRFETVPVAIERSGRWLGPAESAALLPAEAARRCATGSAAFHHEPGRSSGFDVAFPALHGPFGEDGRVQGLLDMADVPYVGSGVLGSACGMDKGVMKRLFGEAGILTAPHASMRRDQIDERISRIEQQIGYPAFAKPAGLGSSVGIRKAANREELREALHYAAEFDAKVIAEKAIEGREIECAVLGNDSPQASVPGEVVAPDGFYDYETKYVNDEAELIVPARLEPAKAAEIQAMAVRAFESIGCAGLARVDFFLENGTGDVLVNEVNTMPGFTSISMYPRLWEASGVPYARLLERLIELAFERHERTRAVRYDVS